MSSISQHIPVPDTLDVEAIERILAELWKQAASNEESVGDDAVLRSRVAGVMVYLSDESLLSDTQQVISELASFHPCRALLMVGDRDAAARDIEMHVAAYCASQKRSGSRNVCCEQITLTAHGPFVSELPSAAVPLLVPDLPVFLWWREEPGAEDKVFGQLCQAADRVVIDSADFQTPPSNFLGVTQLISRSGEEAIALTDINWARLTPWRASLAHFYDLEDCRTELDRITDVRIHFVAEREKSPAVSSQALLIASWLASRLNWKFVGSVEAEQSSQGPTFQFKNDDRDITLSLNEVHRSGMKPGRLCEIELTAPQAPATFMVSRCEDGLHLRTQTTIGERSYPHQLLRVGNWSAAELLSRELEILCKDKIYEDAIERAVEMIRHQPPEK